MRHPVKKRPLCSIIFGDLASDDDADDLEEGDADADPADEVGLALDERLDLAEASVRSRRSENFTGRAFRAFLEVGFAFGILWRSH